MENEKNEELAALLPMGKRGLDRMINVKSEASTWASICLTEVAVNQLQAFSIARKLLRLG